MNRLVLIVALFFFSLLFFGCGGAATEAPSDSSPTPTTNNKATIQAAVKATLTAQPTNTTTVEPSRTSTPTPTPLPTETSTSTLTPIPTPIPPSSSSGNPFFCFSTMLFFLLTLLFGKLFFNRGKKVQEFQKKLDTETQQHNDELEVLEINMKETQDKYDNEIDNLKKIVQRQKEDNYFLLRKKWLEKISRTSFRNEIEVEVKFIHPLVTFLGYKESEFELRVGVNLQLGHNSMRGEADWVLWDRDTLSNRRRAFVVIEAKAPGRSLGEFQEQVRSYAFSLNAPIYVLTNGKDFQIYERGVQRDNLIINCTLANLVDKWPLIEKTIGAKSRSSR